MNAPPFSASNYPHVCNQWKGANGGYDMYKRKLLLALLVLAVAPLMASANDSISSSLDGLKQVKSFPLFGRADSWHELDRDSLIVWSSFSRPYLLKLRRPSRDMRFVHAIGLTSTAGSVSARFDDVIVDGWPYRIESIYALDRAQAKELLSNAHRST
jgi:Family of unknown function (DUF6491)